MSKKYKAIFFDWDGTAVMSRQAPVEEAVAAMKPLLASGVSFLHGYRSVLWSACI